MVMMKATLKELLQEYEFVLVDRGIYAM